MSEAFRRAGILYGRLGMTTPSELIKGRFPAIEAAAKALTIERLPELLLVLFGRTRAEKADFLEHFRSDPTFDVRPADKEAALLATAVADYTMTEELDIAGEVALSVVTAAVGGMRLPAVASDILSIADKALTEAQGIQQAPLAAIRRLLRQRALHRRSKLSEDCRIQTKCRRSVLTWCRR